MRPEGRHWEPPPPAASRVSLSIQDEIDRILPGAVNGDHNAVARLLSIINPLLSRYCRAKMGLRSQSSVTAEDVAQETCIAVLGALPRFQNRNTSFLGFVYSIAFRKVADAFRASARDRSQPLAELPERPATESLPEEHSERADLTRRLRRLLEILPSSQREVLLLRVVVGLSASETAEITGATPGAVRLTQHRALSRLRKEIESGEHQL
ncbi:MAG: RNA polymerase sigma factor ShbA [Sciscionella sp.]